MSIVRIFFNPLDAKSKEEYPIEVGTRIIDFLTDNYPDGFDGYLRVFAGVDEVAIDDLDQVVRQDEQITMLVMPAGAETWAVVVPYIINALIAVAVAYTINLLFPPKTLGGDNESESPTYSLNATRNSARLGDPIACHYGTVSFPPDFASAPSIFYYEESNDQFVDELLVLGHGNYEVEDIFVGDTPIQAIEPGSIRYWIFQPADHLQTMGRISDTISGQLSGTSNTWPFREDLFTSPEVESFVWNNDRSEPVTTPTAFSGVATAEYYDPVAKQYVYGNIREVDSSLEIRAGDTLTLSGSTNNNGDFLVGSVVVDPDNSLWMTVFEAYDSTDKFADEDPLSCSYELNTAADNTVAGPFRAQKVGASIDVIECDLVFQQGLYRVDGTNGNIKSLTVEMELTFQQIDDDGAPVAAAIIVNKEYTSKSRSPLRSTVSSGKIPAGQYEVSIRRVTPISDDDRKHDDASWVGLKGGVVNATQPVYGNVTMLAVRMRATNGLGQAARSRIRVTARRVLDSGDSANPVTALVDVWTNQDYGLARPLEELDVDTLYTKAIEWAQLDSPRFNGSFDQRSTGYEAMDTIASMTGSKVVQSGGLTTIVTDEIQPIRRAIFGAGNIVSGSLEVNYNFQTTDSYKSIQIEYRDPDTFQVAYVSYPAHGLLPDTYTLFGCTDAVYAAEYARYLWNVKTIRRKECRFTTELEGLIPQFGDRIGVAHPMPEWGESGVIVDIIDPQTFRVDKYLDWVGQKVMILRSPIGTPSTQYVVTRGGADDIVVFPSVPDVVVTDAEGQEPTNYIFGTDKEFIADFMVSETVPQGDTTIQIVAQKYTANIYTGAPPHMGEPGCVFIPPTDPVTADLIYTEPTAVFNAYGDEGVFNVEGDIIVAVPGQDTFVHSLDGGDTWEAPQPLPPFIVDNDWGINRILYSEGWWYIFSLTPSEGLMYRTDDYGVTWEEVDLIRGQRSQGGFNGVTFRDDELIHCAGYVPVHLNQFGLMRREVPSGLVLQELSFAESGNPKYLMNMNDGYIVVDDENDIRYVANDLLSSEEWSPPNLVNFQSCDNSLISTAMIYDNNNGLLRWDDTLGASSNLTPEPSIGVLVQNGQKNIRWNEAEQMWFLVHDDTNNSLLWNTYSSSNVDGSNFTASLDLNLPVAQSNTDGDAGDMFVRYSSNGNWYGFYRENGTRRTVLIRFKYGEYVCS